MGKNAIRVPMADDSPDIYKVWVRRLEGDTIRRGLIRQWCNHVVPLARGFLAGGYSSNLDHDHARWLVGIFRDHVVMRHPRGYSLTSDHVRFGREWLGNNLANVGKYFTIPDDFTMDRFMGFQWVGWHAAYKDAFSVRLNVTPVWRVFFESDTGMDHWDYFWYAWQGRAYQGWIQEDGRELSIDRRR